VATSVVRWNGTNRPTTYVGGSQLQATIGAGDIAAAGTASVTVFTPSPGGGQSTALPFTVTAAPAPAPTVTTLTPSSATAGSPGFTLLVGGSGFVTSSVVRWNGADRATTYVSGTQLQAAIGAGDIAAAGTASVTVFTPSPGGGLSAAALSFTIAPVPPVPAVTTLTPSSVAAGSPAFTLTVTGSGFVTSSVVRWNGADRATTYVGGSQLQATVGAGDITAAGTASVTVFTPSPGGGLSGALPFTITAPAASAPTITALTPSSATAGGAAFTLTVDGTRLGRDGAWNGGPRSTTFGSGTRVTASIDAADIAGAGSASVTVRNPDQQISNAQTFTITPASVTCLTGQYRAEYFANTTLTGPAARTACEAAVSYDWGTGGPVGVPVDAFSARWTGRFSFAAGSYTFTARADDGVRVFVDGVQIINAWIVQAPTTYTATRTLTAGEHEVKVEYFEGGGGAVAQVSWGASGPATPTITALTPSSAVVGGPAFTLTVDGTNFVSGATVLWNGALKTTTFGSATRVTASIVATDIATAGSASVTVRNPDQQVSTARTFTITSPQTGELIIDNAAAGVQDAAGGRTFTGTWCLSGSTNQFGTDSLFSCSSSGTDTYRWTPNLPTAGTYDVYVWWTTHAARGTAVPVSVVHANGTATVNFNEQVGGGQWVLHGRYTFSAGTSGYVQVAGTPTQQAAADAVRFVPASGGVQRFSGPYETPYICMTQQAGLGPALDANCTAPTITQYWYRTTGGVFQALADPTQRPGDLSQAVVNGQSMPFIVRVEKGTINRAIYEIARLDDAAGWNGRLIYVFGGAARGAGTSRAVRRAGCWTM
jgi:hypothetical protein